MTWNPYEEETVAFDGEQHLDFGIPDCDQYEDTPLADDADEKERALLDKLDGIRNGD